MKPVVNFFVRDILITSKNMVFCKHDVSRLDTQYDMPHLKTSYAMTYKNENRPSTQRQNLSGLPNRNFWKSLKNEKTLRILTVRAAARDNIVTKQVKSKRLLASARFFTITALRIFDRLMIIDSNDYGITNTDTKGRSVFLRLIIAPGKQNYHNSK
jgi:hypothetical protein